MMHGMRRNHRMGHHGGMHILPLLAIPVAIGVARAFAHHRFAQMSEHEHGRAGWKNGVPPMFAEMHRRAHAAEAGEPTLD